MRLDGKVAIVTGASRGIGKAIALGMARQGVRVVAAARTESEGGKLPGTIHATVKEICDAGGQAFPVRCDVRDEEAVRLMVQAAVDKYGRVDILVNNAAAASYKDILELSAKEWDVVFAVGVRGPFLCTRAVLPAMISQGCGSIVNISSKAADMVFSGAREPGQPPKIIGQAYGASKAALERMTWGLAAELGPRNIAVNALKPLYPVLTEGFALQRPGADASSWVTPDQMVKATIFLAGQDASGVTGFVGTDEEVVRMHGL